MKNFASAAIAALLIANPDASAAEQIAFCGTARWQSTIATAAARFALPERWLHAVMRVESAGCETMHGAPTVSSAGAMGLMQLMPRTWAEYRERLQLGDDPHNPDDNILAGAGYLRDLYDRFGWPGALAAFHAGPTRYAEHLLGTRPLPRSTVEYLSSVIRWLGDDDTSSSIDRRVFVARTTHDSSFDDRADAQAKDRIFIALRRGSSPQEATVQGSPDVQK